VHATSLSTKNTSHEIKHTQYTLSNKHYVPKKDLSQTPSAMPKSRALQKIHMLHIGHNFLGDF